MKKSVILLFLSMTGVLGYGQDFAITEFDLYGCWILDSKKTVKDKGKLIYILREESDTRLKQGTHTICFQAFDECKIIYNRIFVCGNEAKPPDYGWTFEERTGIVTIYSSKKWLKEFKAKHPEEHKKIGSPEKFDVMELRVVELPNGQIGLEKLRKTKHSPNTVTQ